MGFVNWSYSLAVGFTLKKIIAEVPVEYCHRENYTQEKGRRSEHLTDIVYRPRMIWVYIAGPRESDL